jgi:hypothetical protein
MNRDLPQRQQLEAQAWMRLGRYAGHGSAEILSSVPAVSDPGTDFVTSVVTGFTQSETSTAFFWKPYRSRAASASMAWRVRTTRGQRLQTWAS